ncbi:MAG: hypothetical protein A2219_02795 [Elusimicrobia bacterium RIFOXYA2_FULL_50_26]|nr:MAG: hypothetical protein A2219_02795 [Elusimicrobia bacterium RIFOXYA2_FULL_50_26]OGS24309.1 MAG: hypothetical protein A2314_07635 [Elusimicrobia bacterium RIFOXYB2_FULL_50_12]
MKVKGVVLLVSFLFSVGAIANVAAAPSKSAKAITQKTIIVKSFSGTLRIVTPSNKVITVSPGTRAPRIPFGSKIEVVNGKAVIMADDARITLTERQQIQIDKNALTGAIEFTAGDASAGAIKVEIGSTVALLEQGQQINLVAGAVGGGDKKIEVVKGEVTLRTDEGEKKVEAGDSVSVTPGDLKDEKDVTVVPEPPQEQTEASPSSL